MTEPRRPASPTPSEPSSPSSPHSQKGNHSELLPTSERESSARAPAGPAAPRPRPPRTAEPDTAETCLLRALRARTSEERETFAARGLARVDDDDEMTALLLRQLYLVHLDRRDYESALGVAEEMVELGELGDVARQDAARAAMGLDKIDVAAGHLRIAARVCPPDRRAFHFATLGALLRFGGKPQEAVEAFSKASRWSTKERSLYRAQQVLAERDARLTPSADLSSLRASLEELESGRGYALWVLGEICALLGDREASRSYLTRFLSRLSDASPAKCLALRGEIARAEALLQELSA